MNKIKKKIYEKMCTLYDRLLCEYMTNFEMAMVVGNTEEADYWDERITHCLTKIAKYESILN